MVKLFQWKLFNLALALLLAPVSITPPYDADKPRGSEGDGEKNAEHNEEKNAK